MDYIVFFDGEGPDHAPRFKASVNFNGEIFEAPIYCTTLRQAENAAAEVALNILSTRGPSRSLTARIIDETGVYKNLLQETTHKAGLNLPVYTTVRSGFSHLPIFTSTVELAGMSFTGEPAKTKKQSEKNAALSAWSALKRMSNRGIQPPNNKDTGSNEDQEQVVVARFLSNFRSKNDEKPRNPKDRYERRIENACRENYRASNNKLHYYLQRHLDMLSDVSVDHPIQNQMKPGGSVKFPHISSRVLPPVTILQGLTASKESSPLKSSLDSSRISDPVQRRTRLQTKLQEVPLPTEEHKLEEWPREVSIQTGKLNREDSNSSNPNIFCINPVSTAGVIGVSTRGRFNSVYHVPPLTTSTRTCQKHVFSFAPAVHIRSVIPVCAAPPAPTKPLINASSKEKRENSDLDSYSTKIPHTEEVPASSPNYRNLELSTSKNTHFRELDKIIF